MSNQHRPANFRLSRKEVAALNRNRTAWHEAGHGVIYAHYGRVAEMRIEAYTKTHEGKKFRSRGGTRGLPYCRVNSKTGQLFARAYGELSPLKLAAIGWAGVIAEDLSGDDPLCDPWDVELIFCPSPTDTELINGHPHKGRSFWLARGILEKHLEVLRAVAERLAAEKRGNFVRVGQKWLWDNNTGGWESL